MVDKGSTGPRRRAARPWTTAAAALGLALVAARAPVAAQAPEQVSQELFAGSHLEDYVRLLQLTGDAELYPWSIRAFSPGELSRLAPGDSAHPWAARYRLEPDRTPGLHLEPVGPSVRVLYNSGFPFGSNDGPIWAGRGLTTALQGGVHARYGAVSLTLAPIVFRAENADFPLFGNNNRDPYSEFADPMYPFWIDRPQRFGSEPYTRVDPGQSSLRVDLPWIAAGVSTANQFWGPARDNPMILGNNAAGFPHLFAGTAKPWNLYVGRLHGRLVWGSISQSDYSVMADSIGRRFMTGAVAVFVPRGLPGLEIGGARFFHNIWPRDGLRPGDFAQPFESLLKIRLRPRPELTDTAGEEYRRSAPDNQLASIFFRWTLPGEGFEAYGEFAREDHNYDFRDLVLELTHNSGYMVGFRKAWKPEPRVIWSVRGEVVNALPGQTTFARTIAQFPFYIHGDARQGHTQYGQVLGSPMAHGGAGATLALDRHFPGGSWAVDWTRSVENESEEYREENAFPYGERRIDVIHALGASATVFRGRYDVSGRVAAVNEFNRYFLADEFNLFASLTIRGRF